MGDVSSGNLPLWDPLGGSEHIRACACPDGITNSSVGASEPHASQTAGQTANERDGASRSLAGSTPSPVFKLAQNLADRHAAERKTDIVARQNGPTCRFPECRCVLFCDAEAERDAKGARIFP